MTEPDPGKARTEGARGGAAGRTPEATSALLAGYRVLAALAAPFAATLARHRARRNAEDSQRWPERIGRTGKARPAGTLIWVHAASVGEALSVFDLIGRMVRARPGLSVLLTTNTVSAAELAARRLPQGALHQFLPYDFGPGVERFLDHWRPDLAVWVESEFWPRLLRSVRRRGIPAVLVNARVSDRSFARWLRAPRLARALLGDFLRVLVPDEAMAGRMQALGVPPARIAVAGPLKETLTPLPSDPDALAGFRAALSGRPAWLAISTHDGEEAVMAEAHEVARRREPRLLLVLVPRHPPRGDDIARLLASRGHAVRRRSAGELPGPETSIYLADTIGEMGLWLALAPAAFIGGSLVPVGGHNPYEAVAAGVGILHGPVTGNFREIYDRLDAAGGALCLSEAQEIGLAVASMLATGTAAEMAARARAAVQPGAAGGDAAERTVSTLLDLLPGAGTDPHVA